MSFSFIDGKYIAKVYNEKGKNVRKLYVSERKDGPKEVQLDEKHHFQFVPDVNDRFVLYVCGQSGSGKSVYISNVVNEYHKLYPKNEVFLISPSIEDPAFDGKFIQKIKLDYEFLNDDDIAIQEFSNSLVIFDDIEGLNKVMNEKVMEILNKCLTTGRKLKISICVVNHLPTDRKKTSLYLLEATHVCFFPDFLNEKSLKYLLQEYLGLSIETIKKIMEWDSRGILFIRGKPKILLGDHNALICSRIKM
jgi:hypothetical protein